MVKYSPFPFSSYHRRLTGVRPDPFVGFWSSSCIGVSSVVPSILRMSKASHDSPSCFQSGGIEGALGSTPVARRQVTTARIILPAVESTRRVAMALRLIVGGKI